MASIASPNFLAPPPPLRKQGGSLFISLFSSLMLYLNTNTNTGLEGSSVSQTVQFGRKSGFGTRLYAFELAPLPYDKGALAPFISEETLDYHHGKHQKTYVVNLNNLISGTELEGNKTLEEIILITHKQGPLEIFNTAAEVWNHQFYWNSMSPNGGGQPTGQLLNLILKQFISFEIFDKEFRKTGISQFGSGWAWLAYKPQDKKLALVKTSNAENPLVLGYTPLLAIDVWEHAYYIDYRNARANYVDAFMHLVSWEAASKRLEAATVASSAN